MKMNLTTLHGAYHPNNFGDVLILAIQTSWIKEITKGDVALPFATQVYREQIEVSSLKGIESIEKSGQIVYGAGGYLGEPPTQKWRWGFSFFKKHVQVADTGFKNNKDLAIVGTGVGEITNIFTKRKVKKICNRAKLIAVRDEESKTYLKKIGIDDSKINVTADVALSLTKDALPETAFDNLPTTIKSINENLKYGIHIGISKTEQNRNSLENLFKDVLLFLNSRSDIHAVLIIDNDNKAQNDAVKYLSENLKNGYTIFRHKEIWETTAMLSSLDVVLTNKLHVGIVSYALGSIPIAIPYHSKTKRFYRQIKRDDLCLDINNIKSNQVYELLNNTLDDNWKREYKNTYDVERKELYRKSLENKELLKGFLIK
ncbi:polysaccharide pyruvyl transferase family protein [Exiguobacterium acetylicum]|uniref:polysaccharide pyruvyl transferase family protein n=1 Tax=Exiguobacterium acetylicum TaxID=41170 RepID=UPI001EE2F19C|nr:polysaccharide pyruvyl transferase family protein [Exiguobacterium acetylicum]UKS55700.1 polysaccharide pyruvyl transferase family protein [Exiguobacterium acetylicum]